MTSTIPEINISSQGRARALELLSPNRYAGPMPVALASYVAQQSMRNVKVRPTDVDRAFAYLVFDDEVLSEFGSALNSGNRLSLRAAQGGKTFAAEAMSQVFAESEMWISFAVEVAGEIITVYDPAIHGAGSGADSDVEDLLTNRSAMSTLIPMHQE
jgi:hypothetical protein